MHTPKIAFDVHCSTSFPRTLETRLSSDDELWVQQIKHVSQHSESKGQITVSLDQNKVYAAVLRSNTAKCFPVN